MIMILGGVVFAIGLVLKMANLSYSLGDLSAEGISYIVMGLGVFIFLVDLNRTSSRNRSRRARSNAQVAPADQENNRRRV